MTLFCQGGRLKQLSIQRRDGRDLNILHTGGLFNL